MSFLELLDHPPIIHVIIKYLSPLDYIMLVRSTKVDVRRLCDVTCYQFFMRALSRYLTESIATLLCTALDNGHARIPGGVLIDVLRGDVSMLSRIEDQITFKDRRDIFIRYFIRPYVWCAAVYDTFVEMNDECNQDNAIRFETLSMTNGRIRLVDYKNLVERRVTVALYDWLKSFWVRSVNSICNAIQELESRLADYRKKEFDVVIDATGCENIRSLFNVVSRSSRAVDDQVDVRSCPILMANRCICSMDIKPSRKVFHEMGCPVQQCECDSHLQQQKHAVQYIDTLRNTAKEEVEKWLDKYKPSGFNIM